MEESELKQERKSPERYDLSFSFDFDVEGVESNNSSDSETAGLEIDVSEVDNYDSSNKRIKREPTIQDALELNEMEEEIERQLDAKAAKTNLTATNVKNILKHVITNEHVMAMVKRRLNRSTDDDGMIFEPKLTRSKAKELGPLGQPNIPWPTTPVKTASAEVQFLIEEELPEDSSDEEYRPDQDQQSDDEKEADNSVGSDIDSLPSTPATPIDNSSLQELQSSTDIQYDSEGVFKIPEIPQLPTEEESIGQRTRSKLCLSETPLEYIEQAFIPPDITTDMYDHGCEMDEEWRNFLQDFTQPLTQEVNVEDDPEADPEYNILEEDEAELLDKEELRVDKAVKVSRKEVNNLMDELLEYANEYAITHPTEKSSEVQETPKKRRSNEFANTPVEYTPISTSVELISVLSESDLPKLVNNEQRELLHIQLRQHAQLMVQQFVMCYKHPDHHKLAKSCKSNLDSLRYLSSGPNSAFNIENVPPALQLIADWEEMHKNEKFCEEYINFLSADMKAANRLSHRTHNFKFHPALQKLMIESKALSYPYLLPHMFSVDNGNIRKFRSFLNSEENLIALGLEQFFPFVLSKKKHVHKYRTYLLHDVVQLIRTYLLPARDQNSIFLCCKKYESPHTFGPIRYYFINGKAPKTVHVISLDFELRAPQEQPIECLPDVWQTYLENILLKWRENLSKASPQPKQSNKLKKKISNDGAAQNKKLEEFLVFKNDIKPGSHLRNPIVNMMPTMNLPQRKNAKRKVPAKAVTIVATPVPVEIPGRTEVEVNMDVDIPESSSQRSLPKLRKMTPRLAKIRSAQNIKSMTQVVTGKEVSTSTIRAKNKATESMKSPVASTSSSAKGDNEDEIAELMRASTTIKKNVVNRKKAKQARELENIRRLIDSESELNVEERATKFAASYLQKLHSTLEASDPETFKGVIKLFLDYSEKLDNFIQAENENELKTDEGKSGPSEKRLKTNDLKVAKDLMAVDFYHGVCDKLENYPDMSSDFLLFLNSHQAEMVNKSLEWTMLQKMQEFVQVAQVYFAKQPSRLTKVMQSISQLATAPYTNLKTVQEAIGSILKGSPLVMDLFLQVFPMGKPPESLFSPQYFENITCPVGPHDKSKFYAIDAPDLYENIEMPVSTSQEDPYGGENCKCSCHEVTDSKLKSGNEHCASCGTRFLNGRIYLQTSEGLRPAKITFPGENDEKLENIARVSLKTVEKFVHLPPQQKRRRKSSKNDPAPEETGTKQPSALKMSPVKEAPEDTAEKLGAKPKRGPRSPPKAAQPSGSGIPKKTVLISKSQREQRAEKRDAKQEKISSNVTTDSSLNKNQQLEDNPEPSTSFHLEYFADEDDGPTAVNKANDSSDSDSTNAEVEEPAEIRPWSRQEDAILLLNIKNEYSERTFDRISQTLENRTVQQVKDRCRILLTFLEKIS